MKKSKMKAMKKGSGKVAQMMKDFEGSPADNKMDKKGAMMMMKKKKGGK